MMLNWQTNPLCAPTAPFLTLNVHPRLCSPDYPVLSFRMKHSSDVELKVLGDTPWCAFHMGLRGGFLLTKVLWKWSSDSGAVPGFL